MSAKAGAYPVLLALDTYLRLLSHQATSYRLATWELLPEPYKIENRKLRKPVKCQVTLDGGEGKLDLQIGWSDGERTKRHHIPASTEAIEVVEKMVEQGGEGTALSMAYLSKTVYVVLTCDENWIWSLPGGEPVVVVEPELFTSNSEIAFPDGGEDGKKVVGGHGGSTKNKKLLVTKAGKGGDGGTTVATEGYPEWAKESTTGWGK